MYSILDALLVLLAIITTLAMWSALFCFSWNDVMPDIFGLKEISFLQGAKFVTMAMCLLMPPVIIIAFVTGVIPIE